MTAATLTFDTHKFIKLLRDTGMPEPQAEVVIEAISSAADIDFSGIATKGDLRELELRLKVQLGGMIMGLGGVLVAIKYFG